MLMTMKPKRYQNVHPKIKYCKQILMAAIANIIYFVAKSPFKILKNEKKKQK
jgi:hypothetical protein